MEGSRGSRRHRDPGIRPGRELLAKLDQKPLGELLSHPGERHQKFQVPGLDTLAEPRSGRAAQDAGGEPRADSGHRDQILEETPLRLVGESEELERVLADMEVGQEMHLAADRGQGLEAGDRDLEPQRDPAHLDERGRWHLGDERPVDRRDHFTIPSERRGARCRWHSATASASASSSRSFTSPGKSLRTMNDTCPFCALPFRTTAIFTSGAVYSNTLAPLFRAATRTTPRTCPIWSAALALFRTNTLSTATSAGCISARSAARVSWIWRRRSGKERFARVAMTPERSQRVIPRSLVMKP